jgi:hypothetical protein
LYQDELVIFRHGAGEQPAVVAGNQFVTVGNQNEAEGRISLKSKTQGPLFDCLFADDYPATIRAGDNLSKSTADELIAHTAFLLTLCKVMRFAEAFDGVISGVHGL